MSCNFREIVRNTIHDIWPWLALACCGATLFGFALALGLCRAAAKPAPRLPPLPAHGKYDRTIYGLVLPDRGGHTSGQNNPENERITVL